MGEVGEYALPELQGKTPEQLTGLLDRARDVGLLTHLGSSCYTIHPVLPWYLSQCFAQHYDGQDGQRGRRRHAARLGRGCEPTEPAKASGGMRMANVISFQSCRWKRPTCCTPAAPPAGTDGGIAPSLLCRVYASFISTKAAWPNGPDSWRRSCPTTVRRMMVPSPAGKRAIGW